MDFDRTIFHGYGDIEPPMPEIRALPTQAFNYRFSPHFHPYAAALIKRLVAGSLTTLQAADTEIEPRAIFTATRYNPTSVVATPHPAKGIDFEPDGAYAVYNWELFYHVPLAIAIHLSKNQRFDEAQQWFHYVFDPTDNSDEARPQRFWKVKPFKTTDVEQVEELLVTLATGEPPERRDWIISSIAAWKDAPFRPHVVARYRQSAYMFKTIMAYLDNLLAWGDSLFRQDTGETINEAAQIYVLAANILGPRPQAVPKTGSPRPQTYASLRPDLDRFANAMREIEGDISFDAAPFPSEASDDERLAAISSLGNALYFCVPRNDKLLGYWDTIADRLFKIRNSLNIQGTFRQLALFEPAIDPALLARGAAAGLDVAAIVSGVNQPLPLVRFQVLVQKAVEICQEVKSMGNNLLAAIEKEDNEALAILRARHERQILGLAENVRYAQWQEAIKAREGLDASLANAIQRYAYYERLLGKREADIDVPDPEALDTDGLRNLKFGGAEPEIKSRHVEVDIAPGGPGTVGSLSSGLLGAADITAGKKISSHEFTELDRLEEARLLQLVAANFDLAGSGVSLIPQFNAHGTPLGVGVATGFGGVQLSKMLSMMASFTRISADELSYQASKAAKIGSYARREQDWGFQSNLAAGEINQIFKQLRAAEIREFIAEREWENHKIQIRNAEEIEQFLTDERTGKKTNRAFYAWMKREVRGLYSHVFQFAFDVAKKAERALQHELGDPELSFLQFGYLAGKEGLLAGEKLYLDLKRMEMAHHELNKREYELTQNVSLVQLNPQALVDLRATGKCTVFLPEELFDLGCPGHYFRRLKYVAVSIPSVAGPYTAVNCTLTLLKSAIRKEPTLDGSEYARTGAEDARFSDHFGSLQSIVTSTGQNDAGLFETNLHDERYLPFEGAGLISEWSVELSGKWTIDGDVKELAQFDFATISDVILHLRYTARDGGGLLRQGAIANLETRIAECRAPGSIRLFSVRHEFPTEWARFKGIRLTDVAPVVDLSLTFREEHYPFWSKGRRDVIAGVELIAKTDGPPINVSYEPGGAGTSDHVEARLGDLRRGALTHFPLRQPVGSFALYLDDNSMEELWLAVTWGGRS
jgi:hypothetical protein